MNKFRMIVLDDYEGELAISPAMMRLRQLAEVQILDRPIHPDDHHILKDVQILLALRERTMLDGRFFEACPNLELVLQTGGHAYHIDQTAASKQGIVIALGRRVSKPTVVIPELVFSLMLGLVRQIYPLTTEMHNGRWPELIGGSLSGRTLGILGYGRLGHPVARLAEAFGMRVVAWDRNGSSRGAIVDEPALLEALRERRLAGAGLDVFCTEPLPQTSELRTMPNVLLTPHVGWKVREVLHEFVEIAADQLDAWLSTGLSKNEVLNPDAMDVESKRSGTLGP